MKDGVGCKHISKFLIVELEWWLAHTLTSNSTEAAPSFPSVLKSYLSTHQLLLVRVWKIR